MSRFVRFSLLALAIVAQSARLGYSQATPSTTPPEFEAGVQKLREGKVEAAIQLFREAQQKHPEIAPPWVIMYNIFREGDANRARQCLEQAVIDTPTDPEAYVIMGNMALNERRIAEAELLFYKAQTLLSTFTGSPQRKKILEPLTLSGLANVDELRTRWDLAEKQLSTILTMEPKNASVMMRMARALFFEKKTPESYKMLQDAKAADKANVLTPEAALAGFYEQYGDRPDAVIWYDKALKSAPNDLATRRVVAQWALNTGDIKKAKEQADACLKLDPRSLENMLLRGVIALFEEDYPKAEEYFQLAHLESPINFLATNNLALALCEEGDPAKLQRALEYAKQNYDANQRNPDACSTLGWVLFNKKEYDQAALALRTAAQARNGSVNPDTAYYLARVEYVRGNKKDAKTVIDQIMKTEQPFSKRKAAKKFQDELAVELASTATPTTPNK